MPYPIRSLHRPPRSFRLLAAYAAAAFIAAQTHADTADISSTRSTTYDIKPTQEHPRSSEGSFVTLKSGRIAFYYSQFFGGHGDVSAAEIVEIHSDDRGLTWSQPILKVPRGTNQNVMSVSLLRLSDGKLALFYCPTETGDTSRPCMCLSADEGESWSPPSQLISTPGWFVLNNDRVIQTGHGRIIVPLAFHRVRSPLTADAHSFDSAPAIALWYLSDDDGWTWRESRSEWGSPVASQTGFQEPGVVELADGSLFSWTRTDQGVQYGFRSTDGGETWSAPEPTTLASPQSPACIKRLPNSTALLAIFNDHSGQFPQGVGQQRTPLVAAISRDGGKTWPVRKLIEGDPKGNYAYSAIYFVDDEVLLAYIAVDGPNNRDGVGNPDPAIHQNGFGTRIRRIPLAWLSAGD